MNSLHLSDYLSERAKKTGSSAKTVVLTGDTKPYRDLIKENKETLGMVGWNKTAGGWLFKKTSEQAVIAFFKEQSVPVSTKSTSTSQSTSSTPVSTVRSVTVTVPKETQSFAGMLSALETEYNRVREENTRLREENTRVKQRVIRDILDACQSLFEEEGLVEEHQLKEICEKLK